MSNLLSELDAVVGLSERATQGQWTATVGHDVKQQGGVTVVKAWEGRGPQQEHNAEYIAAINNLFRTHHAEIAADAKDAARWRHITSAPCGTVRADFHAWLPSYYHWGNGKSLDEQIDAAMSAREGE